MRNLIALLGICLFTAFACDSIIVSDEVETAKAIAVAQPLSPDTLLDSIKPKSSRTMTDPARSIHQIDTVFPYDITVKTIDGKLVSSSSILKSNGKPTIVLFWLTTCFPCRIEMKAIQKEIDQWKAETDFNIVAISTDFEKNYDNVVKMVHDSNWSFESYWDMNREFRKVLPGKLNGLPQSFIFDKDGNIAYHKRKYSSGDEHKLYAKVKELAAR